MPKLIAVSETGRPLGENHPKAVLTDNEVEQLLMLRQQGYTYQWLVDKFDVCKSTVASICRGRTRCQPKLKWKQKD